jgi:hypothetical protein
MRKFAWAALLSLPFAAVGADRASAGCCLNLQGGFRVKICAAGYLNACREPFSVCPPCGPGGGGYGGGYGGGFCGANGQDCSGAVPGPWYTYWPYGGAPLMTSGQLYPGWTYDQNFQVPAPVPYPYWPAAASTAASSGAYFPSYWGGQ